MMARCSMCGAGGHVVVLLVRPQWCLDFDLRHAGSVVT